MALSPNAGKDKYLLEKYTGTVHYLKKETENCEILKVGPDRAHLTSTYEQAEDISLIKYSLPAKRCKYCFGE